jgi:hypothetical protein
MSREAHVRFCERAGLRCSARLTQIHFAPPAVWFCAALRRPAEIPAFTHLFCRGSVLRKLSSRLWLQFFGAPLTEHCPKGGV